MRTKITTGRRWILAAAVFMTALFDPAPALAAPVAFSAHVDGQSDIVGVLDPNGPVVQIQTTASGLGTLGTLSYFSADEVNLGTGQGAGRNRFVADDGSEIFGIFTVQLVPTSDPALLDLFGDVDFTGGSGRFAGADGFAHFTGAGTFISATTALSRFDFSGELLLVPEPPSAALGLAALLAALISRRARPGFARRQRGVQGAAYLAATSAR
ncbi:MAG: hypothetical protein Q8K96_15795 [Rubrivivax sp.]|nr:hypothetical protein [Rubrivivax sp.]